MQLLVTITQHIASTVSVCVGTQAATLLMLHCAAWNAHTADSGRYLWPRSV